MTVLKSPICRDDAGALIVACSTFLGQLGLESSGVKAHAERGTGEPFMSDSSGLLPIALCGSNVCDGRFAMTLTYLL
jgi:hypothetical protein